MPAIRCSAVLASVHVALAPPARSSPPVARPRGCAAAGGSPQLQQPPVVQLRGGLQIPAIGLGCGYGSHEDVAGRAMLEAALDSGYAHIDTAQRYGTEPAVGEALAARFAAASSGLRREDVWVTTKVANPRPAPPGMNVGGGIGYMLRRDMDPFEGLRDEFAGCLKNLQLVPARCNDHPPAHPPAPPPPTNGTNDKTAVLECIAWSLIHDQRCRSSFAHVGWLPIHMYVA